MELEQFRSIYSDLCDQLFADDVTAALCQSGIITPNERDDIYAASSSRQKTTILLAAVERATHADSNYFNTFIDILATNTKYTKIVQKIRGPTIMQQNEDPMQRATEFVIKQFVGIYWDLYKQLDASEVIPPLFTNGLMSSAEKDEIDPKLSNKKQVVIVLAAVERALRANPNFFATFIQILRTFPRYAKLADKVQVQEQASVTATQDMNISTTERTQEMSMRYEPLSESKQISEKEFDIKTILHIQAQDPHPSSSSAMTLQALNEIPGYGMNIAIIDSGIMKEHPAFKEKRIHHKLSSSYVTSPYDVDNNGHGTAVASMLFGIYPGVSSNMSDPSMFSGYVSHASMVILKVTNASGSNVDPTLVCKALEDIFKWNQNHLNDRISIVVLSLGSNACDQRLATCTQNISDDGTIVVACAGNVPGVPWYPGKLWKVLGIGSCNRDGTAVSSFSATGLDVDFYAPGEKIPTASVRDEWQSVSGTSYSAPFVAGIVCCILQDLRQKLTKDQYKKVCNVWIMKKILQRIATPGVDGCAMLLEDSFKKFQQNAETILRDLKENL